MNLDEFQREHKAWAARNFPNRTPSHPFWGAVEEVGELHHAVLKMEQQNRGTREEHLAEVRNAAGDILVFLTDLCSVRSWSIQEAFDRSNRVIPRMDPFFGLVYEMGCLAGDLEFTNRTHVPGSLVRMLVYLREICRKLGLGDLLEILEETWKRSEEAGLDCRPGERRGA